MHIIQVSSYYPPHLGGQENVVCSLTMQLAAAGHEVDVLTSTLGGGLQGVSTENGVRVTRLPGFVFGHAPIMPAFLPALSLLMRPDSVVHLHIGQAFTPEMVALLTWLRKSKFIAELHIDFEPSGPAGLLLPLYKKMVLKKVLHAAAAVVVLGKSIKQTIESRYDLKSVRVLSNGISPDFLELTRPPLAKKPPRRLCLLFVGRLSKQKNLKSLLQAIARTPYSVTLDVVGDGDEMAAIKMFIKSHHLSSKVTLHGRLDKPAVMKFYQTSHALVVPSLYEAQPMVLLEAMAARLPIIGTNVVGVGEHIREIGIVVPPTTDGLLGGIDRYYSDYKKLPTMVKKGYDKAQARSWPALLKVYEKLYESVLAN